MQAFKEWSIGKPDFLASFAQQSATSAEGFCEIARSFYGDAPRAKLLSLPVAKRLANLLYLNG